MFPNKKSLGVNDASEDKYQEWKVIFSFVQMFVKPCLTAFFFLLLWLLLLLLLLFDQFHFMTGCPLGRMHHVQHWRHLQIQIFLGEVAVGAPANDRKMQSIGLS